MKKVKRKEFVHLHVHSRMSTSDGLCEFEDIVERVVNIGQPSIAMTDHYYMYNIPEFYYECIDKGVKPILGCELGIYPESESALLSKYDLGDDETKKEKTISYFHGLFLAKDFEGYQNLMKLASLGTQDDRFYRKPRVKRADILKYHKGLIFCSACLAGEIPKLITGGNMDFALKVLAWYHKVFRDDFYLEIQDHGIKDQEKVNKQLIKWARRYNLNLVLTNDTHYTVRELAESHRLLLCANWRMPFSDKQSDVRTKYFPTDEFYIKTSDEMYEIAKKWNCIDAYENTYKIMEKCNVEIPKTTHYPVAKLHLTDDGDPNMELKLLIEERKWNKYTDKGSYVLTPVGDKISKDDFDKRLKKEIDDIALGQVADYFLNVCYGITDYCAENDILIGAGRGSAAGSVVSYILNITDVEPIALNLTWERFWNPGRMKYDEDGNIIEISLPDIDIDIPSDRRIEVMDHCKEYFGHECVANIITFGTWSGKNLVRAAGEALGVSKQVIEDCCEYIYYGLSDALAGDAFKEFLENNKEASHLINKCVPLEGCVKNASTHAAGMLIADSDMTKYTPFTSGKNGITTQYPFETLEKIGCLKVDLLGHEAEVVIDRACQYISENHSIEIVPREIPIDDKPTYRMLQKCDVRGVPQIEKNWVLDIIQDVHPEVLEHIIALVTMIRPGSLDSGQTEKYRKIRKGVMDPTPDIPQVEAITKETYGTWLYQEQVMDVVKYCAGFTLGQADDLRKVVAKKKYADKAEKLMSLFKDGSINGKGKSEPLSYEEWELMDSIIRNFFKYAFNKAHAAGYGTTSYRCAYLKANYFIEYMTALLNSKDTASLPFYLENIYEHGYKVMPPDINTSGFYWTCKNGELRPSLSIVQGCGPSAVNAIVEERELNGNYKSFEDFLIRTPSNVVKSNVITNLICAGVFGSLGYTIKTLWEACYDTEYIKTVRKSDLKFVKKNKLSLGGDEFDIHDIQEDEEFLMGFVITLSDKEFERRRRSIFRKVDKYRNYVFKQDIRSAVETNRGMKMKSRSRMANEKRQKLKEKINGSNSDEEVDKNDNVSVVTELFMRISVVENKMVSKIMACISRNNNNESAKTYHVVFIVSSKDGNEYILDTKLMVNAKCFVRLKKILGDERIYLE